MWGTRLHFLMMVLPWRHILMINHQIHGQRKTFFTQDLWWESSDQEEYGRCLKTVVPGTKGREKEILDYLDGIANKGMICPWINDCRTVIDETLEDEFGINVPPQTPGRINGINWLRNVLAEFEHNLYEIMNPKPYYYIQREI
jgi:hypothetical protein